MPIVFRVINVPMRRSANGSFLAPVCPSRLWAAPRVVGRRGSLLADSTEEDVMAGLMSRASLVVKAKLSKVLDKAEDPAETLDYSYEKQLELLQNVKRGVADVVTAKKRLQMQEEQLQQSLVTLEQQARQALGAGREDLARQALERKSGIQLQLRELDAQAEQLEQQQEKLVANEKALQAKIEAFRSQKEVIKAQYSAAEASVRINEAATGIGEQMADTGLAIQRAKEKTQQMQARAAAVDELVASGALEDFTSDKTELDRELAQISSQTEVDQELAKMKAELGAGEKPKELGAGEQPKEAQQ
jgi:phage shock protein A